MNESQARSGMRSCEASISSRRASIADADAKIARLRAAYDQIGQEKSAVDSIGMQYRVRVQQAALWSGALRRDFDSAAVDRVFSETSGYLSQADRCRDQIRDAITRLENQKADDGSVIGWLQQRWNDFCGWLEKNTN